uniref:SH3 domain-containing protein n=1 Tax=Ciona intestinalis TaxID=7719 RepID=F6S5L9_CIOIN
MHVLAKAIYDNAAETEDEITFNRGDIVTIIEQNTAGLEGWWLCSLNGRQGIAPGNRLRILPGMYEGMQNSTGGTAPEETYDVPPTHYWNSPNPQIDQDEEYDIPRRQLPINRNNNNGGLSNQQSNSPTEIYDIPRPGAWRGNSVDGEEVYDVPQASAFAHASKDEEQEVYDVPSSLTAVMTPDPSDLYDVPPIVSRGPQSAPEDVYDVPPRRTEPIDMDAMFNAMNPEDVYDVPPSTLRLNTSTLSRSAGNVLDTFETPNSQPFPTQQESMDRDVVYDIPQSRLSSLRRMRREMNQVPDPISKPINENTDYIYDVPPQVTRDGSSKQKQTVAQKLSDEDVVDGLIRRLSLNEPSIEVKQNNRLSVTSRESYSSYIDNTPGLFDELNIDVDVAVNKLIETKQELEDSVSNLLTLVKENWRKPENISDKVDIVHTLFLKIMVAVNHFLTFARGATANSVAVDRNGEARASKNVQLGLRKQLVPIEEDLGMENSEEVVLDAVDSFVMTSRAVSDDASQLANFIHSHIHVLFTSCSPNKSPVKSSTPVKPNKPFPQAIQALQARPLPAVPASLQQAQSQSTSNTIMLGEDAWLEDYDYVALQDKDEFELSSHETSPMSGLNKRRTQIVTLDSKIELKNNTAVFFNSKDREYLLSLKIDVPALIHNLSKSIDRFVSAVDAGNPPHSFVPLGKYVIFSAHQLVFVGDSMCQRLQVEPVKQALQRQCTNLCSILKRTVVATKGAALQWPSVSAVQEMVDRMSEIATSAHQIRITLTPMLSN